MFFSAIKLSGITLRKDNNVGSAANTSTRVKLLDALTLNTHPKQKREENESYYFLDVIFNQLELNMYVRTKMLQMLKRRIMLSTYNFPQLCAITCHVTSCDTKL